MKKINLYNIMCIAIFSIGILLLVFMITYEGELGALPLILIILGASGYFIRRIIMPTRKGE